MDYATQPVREQTEAIHTGAITAETLVRQTRLSIERQEPGLSAWVALATNHIDHARTVDQTPDAGPLSGLSIGVKDLIDVAGLPTRAGSPVTPAGSAIRDAPCVARFRDLGAIVQGKTVTTEFGYFAPGPTRNPHAPNHTPGGSSSGSAAAVGAGTIPIALGTQTAGSLTRPASFCGTAGMVLAPGATDLRGVAGLSTSLDSLGLLTRTVADLHYVYTAFTGSPTPPTPVTELSSALIWTGSDLGELHPAMAELLATVPDLLRAANLEPEKFDADDHVRTLTEDHATVMSYEAAHTLHDIYNHQRAALSSPLRALIEHGLGTPGIAHTAALTRRDRSRDLLTTHLGHNTVIIGPAALGPAPAGLTATGSPILSRAWQLLGCPVVIIPGGRTADGLPLGLQLIGLPGDEPALLTTATELEHNLRRQPSMSPPPAN
ncbi:amidase [Gordonia aichiensis]|uniref:amidase n=1 Tax=Gordonia aichiensis NBRC 108223 TaxID=1220583 RepID=L7KSN3_9ACTN|nr:amidase [Gordonia aichiensis]GAC50733.1 putative amidase [Gordonia aichiensis NBRC 108223]